VSEWWSKEARCLPENQNKQNLNKSLKDERESVDKHGIATHGRNATQRRKKEKPHAAELRRSAREGHRRQKCDAARKGGRAENGEKAAQRGAECTGA